MEYLGFDEILVLHAEGSYTWVHSEGGNRHLVSRNLHKLELLLPSQQFFRCHRAHVINLCKVTKLIRNDGYRAMLVTGIYVEVSRRHWQALLDVMQSFCLAAISLAAMMPESV